MLLSKEQKEQIQKLIKECEQKSSAELVAVITKRSGNYTHIWTFIALFIMFILSFLMILFTQNINPLFLIWIQLATFGIIFLFCYLKERECIGLIPKKYRYLIASDFATANFFNLGLADTKTQSAIMFFVSVDEKYVKIVTDETISKKLEDSYWQSIVDEFIKYVHEGKFSAGYLKAITRCCNTLVEKFPIQDDDENELSNEVIELR